MGKYVIHAVISGRNLPKHFAYFLIGFVNNHWPVNRSFENELTMPSHYLSKKLQANRDHSCQGNRNQRPQNHRSNI